LNLAIVLAQKSPHEFMKNFERSDLNLIDTWLQPGGGSHSAGVSCFQHLLAHRVLESKPLKRLGTSTGQHSGLKAGVNKIKGSAQNRD
jgi:hypothetical protein